MFTPAPSCDSPHLTEPPRLETGGARLLNVAVWSPLAAQAGTVPRALAAAEWGDLAARTPRPTRQLARLSSARTASRNARSATGLDSIRQSW
jgi:hypothetical protein